MKSKVITILLAAILLINTAGIVFLIREEKEQTKEEKQQTEIALAELNLKTYQTISSAIVGYSADDTEKDILEEGINKALEIQESFFPEISINRMINYYYDKMFSTLDEEQKEKYQQEIERLKEELKEINN